MILISSLALEPLYSSPRVILCEQSLHARFTNAVKTPATIIAYSGKTIGEPSSPDRISLMDLGLPVALEMIIAPANCPVAAAIGELVASSGFPHPVPVLELKPVGYFSRSSDQLAIVTAYQRALDDTITALSAHVRQRESEVVALRRRVEAQTLANNHLSDFLSMLGYASQELTLEHIPDIEAPFLEAPFRQALPTLLSDIAGLSLYSAPSESETRADLSISVGDAQLWRGPLTLSRQGGWQDLFFPAGFLHNNHDAVLTVDTDDGAGAPAFALAEGISDSRTGLLGNPDRSVALRIWRHADARIHALRSTTPLYLPRPSSLEDNILAPEAIRRSLHGQSLAAIVSHVEKGFVQTHPVPGELANFVVRDLALSAVTAIETLVSLPHREATPVRFMLHVLPQVDDEALYEAICRAAAGQNMSSADHLMAEITLTAQQHQVLHLQTGGLDRNRLYCLVLATQAPTAQSRFAWAQWRSVGLHVETVPRRQTYRFSYLAALNSQLQYADGPLAENEINERLGYPVLMVSDGERFLQTHAIDGQVVAARLDAYVPSGMQRLWVEVSNDHGHASPTEFGMLLSPDLIEDAFDDHYTQCGYGELADHRLHRLAGGRLMKKLVLDPLERSTLDIFLTEPLERAAHLYLFVKIRSGAAQYAWCRWHKIAMTILAQGNAASRDDTVRANAQDG